MICKWMWYSFFLLLGLCLVGSCSKTSQEGLVHKHGIKVLSTTAMIDDLVGRVGGDRICHQVLIQGEIDPHSYEIG